MNAKLKFVAAIFVLFAFFFGSPRCACAAPPANACSLLTPGQVSAIVGTPVGAGTPLIPTSPKECQWRATTAGTNIRVQLFLKDARAFALAKMPVQGVTKAAVSGIGDDALYSSGPVLSVKKGDVAFNVHILSYGLPEDKAKEMEKSLALEVLAKL